MLKVTPHVKGDGDVGMDIEADYKALGTLTLNTVPSLPNGNLPGTWCCGRMNGRCWRDLIKYADPQPDGLAGLSDIPGLNQLLSQNNREKTE